MFKIINDMINENDDIDNHYIFEIFVNYNILLAEYRFLNFVIIQ
jgi:hypothetical protein